MEPAPRYHARDTAIYGFVEGCKVLLGSAAPSLDLITMLPVKIRLSKANAAVWRCGNAGN